MPAPCRPVERRPILLIRLADICPSSQQRFKAGRLAMLRSWVRRRGALTVGCKNICIGVQQSVQASRVAASCCRKQRSCAPGVCCIDICPRLQQQIDAFIIAASCGSVEGCAAARAHACVDIGPCLSKKYQALPAPKLGCHVNRSSALPISCVNVRPTCQQLAQ